MENFKKPPLDRRTFLKTTGLAAVGLGFISGRGVSHTPDTDKSYTIKSSEEADWTRHTIPFSRGVNFTNWLDDLWSGHLPPDPRSRRWFENYSEADFANAKLLGLDFVRLPIAPHYNARKDPNGTLDPIFLEKLDLAVEWAEKHEMFLIIDNHEYDGAGINESIEPLLINAWRQIAERYKDRSEFIIYEVLNEPCYIDESVWNAIQGRVVDEIRKIDNKHYIIVGGADWNSKWTLLKLPIYPHERLIYTFHFYEPSLLTHAGIGAQADVRDIPFPYDSARMPSPPPGVEAWVVSFYGKYNVDGTEADLANRLDLAVAFAKENNVPLYVGEYGCNNVQISQEDRVRYYETITRLFTERNIPHANWGYKYNEFGMTNGRGGVFPEHLNIEIVRAMGLNPPEIKN